jgi:3-oxoacyl-[acyl-carrier-protein] synthase III
MFISAIGVATAPLTVASSLTPQGGGLSPLQARLRRRRWMSTVDPEKVARFREGITPKEMTAEFSPTSLGVEAVHRAAAEAGLALEEIGLCVASSLTPFQTTPSEAQRIAGQLGLKIPAYDLPGGPAAWWVHLDTFSKFKRERLPEYIACVYTDCPNHGIDSAATDYIGIFGDMACAVILAPRKPARLRLSSITAAKQNTKPAVKFSPFRLTVLPQYLFSSDELLGVIDYELKAWEKGSGSTRDKVTRVILPELYAPELAASAEKLGLDTAQFTASSLETGYALGASAPCSVAWAARGLGSGETILAIQCGDGYAGHAFMTVEE